MALRQIPLKLRQVKNYTLYASLQVPAIGIYQEWSIQKFPLFGRYHYKYDSGHEGDAPLAGFSPRKAAMTVYFYLPEEKKEEFLSKLGKHTSSKACIYIKKLADIDIEILKKIVLLSMEYTLKLYPPK